VGTLDNPLGTAVPKEVVLPTSLNLPAWMLYVGGGPVYQVPSGLPGAGALLLVYQAARASYTAGHSWPDCNDAGQNCDGDQVAGYAWLGLAYSTDQGQSWSDLGRVIGPATTYTPQTTWNYGPEGLVAVPNSPSTSSGYFYIYFPDLIDGNAPAIAVDTGFSVARVPYSELLTAAAAGSPIPAFEKYNAGQWSQPGMGGNSTSVLDNAPGDNMVHWNSSIRQFVAIFDNQSSEQISYSESPDGIHWTPTVVLHDVTEPNINIEWAEPIGEGTDPNVLGTSFYIYYNKYPTDGTGWSADTVARFEVACQQ
jgi:hypothetical protein